MRQLLGGLAIVLLIAAATGCSSSGEGEPVASSEQTATNATAAPGSIPGGEASGDSSAPAGMPSAMPAGAMPAGAMPAGAMPAGAMPAGAMPAGAMPGYPGMPGQPGMPGSTAIPPGGYPPATPGTGNDPAVAGAPYEVAPGEGLPGTLPPGSMPSDPTALTGTSGYPLQPGTAPPGYIGPGGMPPGSAIPGAGVPGIPGSGVPGGLGGPAPTTYDGLAQHAFQQGRERDGIHYLQAWALTSDAGASEVLSGIQWVNGLKRPTMAVRWGIGVQLAMPARFTGDVKPIGSQQQFAGGRGRPGGGGEGGAAVVPGVPGIGGVGGPGEGAGGGAGGGMVAQFAGDFGRRALEEFQARVADGRFGQALKKAAAGGLTAGGGIAGSGIPGEPGGEGAAGGLAAPGFGGPGMRPPGMGGGAIGGVGASAGGASMISAGLTLLGSAPSEKDLKDKAIKEKVDVLVVFRVKVTVNRAGLINNDTEMAILDPVKGKELISSTTLNNIKIQKDREASKEDAVEKEVTKLFEFIDKDLIATEMPAAITPEIVRANRVEKQLLAGTIDDPLAVLTEIRFYHRNKLLSDADTAAALGKVVGPEAAKTLLEGKEEDRKKVVEKWLPKS